MIHPTVTHPGRLWTWPHTALTPGDLFFFLDEATGTRTHTRTRSHGLWSFLQTHTSGHLCTHPGTHWGLRALSIHPGGLPSAPSLRCFCPWGPYTRKQAVTPCTHWLCLLACSSSSTTLAQDRTPLNVHSCRSVVDEPKDRWSGECFSRKAFCYGLPHLRWLARGLALGGLWGVRGQVADDWDFQSHSRACTSLCQPRYHSRCLQVPGSSGPAWGCSRDSRPGRDPRGRGTAGLAGYAHVLRSALPVSLRARRKGLCTHSG